MKTNKHLLDFIKDTIDEEYVEEPRNKSFINLIETNKTFYKVKLSYKGYTGNILLLKIDAAKGEDTNKLGLFKQRTKVLDYLLFYLDEAIKVVFIFGIELKSETIKGADEQLNTGFVLSQLILSSTFAKIENDEIRDLYSGFQRIYMGTIFCLPKKFDKSSFSEVRPDRSFGNSKADIHIYEKNSRYYRFYYLKRNRNQGGQFSLKKDFIVEAQKIKGKQFPYNEI